MKFIQVKAPTWMELRGIVSDQLEIPEEQASYLLWKSNLQVQFLRFVTHELQLEYNDLFQHFIEYDGSKYKKKYLDILEQRKKTGQPFKIRKRKTKT